MSPIRSAARRSTAPVATLLGVFALLLSSAAPAASAPGPGNIDDGRSGSITIHKFAEPEGGGTAHNGQKLDPTTTAGLTPLQGVEFSITNLGLDLDTAEGWRAAEALRDDDILKVVDKVGRDSSLARTEAITGALGSVETNLPLGLYLVEEITSGSHRVVAPVDPFLVSLPTAVDDRWLYNVHAYPKNSVVTLGMSVQEDKAFGLGDVVTWEIDASIPRLPAERSFTGFSLSVAVDPRLSLTSKDEVVLSLVDGDEVPREAYELLHDPENGTLTIKPHPEALSYLREFQGHSVRLTVPTSVTSNTNGEGVIKNTATMTVNGNTVAPATASTSWGAVKVVTRAGGGGLAGAQYQVRRGSDNGEIITVAGQDTFTSDSNGEVIIPGLRAGGDYVLVETKAPQGYTAMSESRSVKVVAADVEQVKRAQSAHSNVITIDKEQVSGFVLPSTGSFGSLPFLLAGLLLVATALVVNRRRRRRLAQAV
ncbi:SpaH/EbpB family LPXTG-anchored major pilin [Nesterenkonia sp. E16_7]|uniref:SpaH/EbpB family LPXTG-anchored major pilin n=1 Tax=unclassified Nesterenkonia TaxID=2629769 RepID=UPI001A90CE7D|nr:MULTISPECIES: SpaH/EbpB family LPXTG-anchored major pilin [unclassified Nesterenkonia]MBO0595322.1 SpaH/EbpB family LPXTG-anchored major pilin [Nesterenkonia sp. E16_10]MBO0599230.1 SpaH/EbpB family LPXTG-anchored major pilin [Nesterenkonia sp. E16_7]